MCFIWDFLLVFLLIVTVFLTTIPFSTDWLLCILTAPVGAFCCFSPVQLYGSLWTAAHQDPVSMGFPRQEYWNELLWPPPGDLSHPGIKPLYPALQADFYHLSHQWKWKLISHVWLFATAWTIQSMEFSRPEYWRAFCFSRGSFQYRDWIQISCITGRFFTSWATKEAQILKKSRHVIFIKGKIQIAGSNDRWCHIFI